MICLGCGVSIRTPLDCTQCFERLKRTVASGHWPLETSLSLRALMEVERAVSGWLDTTYGTHLYPDANVRSELEALTIRLNSYFQHVVDDTREAETGRDPLLD